MDLGSTIKKIRVERGLKQKEVCENIVTMSYYSRIERNISDPTITVFLKILSRLNISFDEFMFIHNCYKEEREENLWFELTELYHSGNLEGLYKIHSLLEKNDEKKDIIDLFIMRLTGEILKPIENLTIFQRIMKIEYWTSNEVKLFTSIMDLLPIDALIILVDNMLRKRTLYTKSKGFNSPYSKILINAILLCIDAAQFSKAEKYLDEYQRTIEIRDFYGHAMAIYLEGLLLFMRGESQIGQQKVDRFFDICKLLDLDHFSQKYKDYFDRLIN